MLEKTRRTRGTARERSAPSALFVYSDAEWAEINAAVVAVRGTSLSLPERASLIKAACIYWRNIAERRNGTYLPPAARAKLWEKVAELCALLCEALEAAGRSRARDRWREYLARMRLNSPKSRHRGRLTIGDLIGLLTQARQSAARRTNPLFLRVPMLVSHSGRLDPQIIYFQHVLWLWTDVFGGRLGRSRNPSTGKLGGPLVRYFRAVTRPVMGGEAPALESLPSIIKRQRAFSRYLDDEYIPRAGVDRAELAHLFLLD